VDAATLALYDGSGLSRQNLLTPAAIVQLLRYLHRNAPAPVRAAFYDSLPVGGEDGTLRNRFKGTAGAGNVRAKTGTLTGAAALSGYVTTRAGEPLVFSILMNHYLGGSSGARAAQNALVLALMEAPRPNPAAPLPENTPPLGNPESAR
jgi:D-alanyl-D-alanine carboxypeptidase/D-alanyl-D-alanine-endopeptidase (penicillin-binding protein 4)